MTMTRRGKWFVACRHAGAWWYLAQDGITRNRRKARTWPWQASADVYAADARLKITCRHFAWRPFFRPLTPFKS